MPKRADSAGSDVREKQFSSAVAPHSCGEGIAESQMEVSQVCPLQSAALILPPQALLSRRLEEIPIV